MSSRVWQAKLTAATVFLNVFAVWATPSSAQSPAITSHSGSLTHGSSVTLTVRDAGTKPANTPFIYDSANGNPGDQLEPRGWLVHVNTPRPVLASDVVRATPGRVTSIKMTHVTGGDNPGFSFGDNGMGGGYEYLSLTPASAANRRVPPTKMLIDYWMYLVQSTTSNNYKFMRWHSRFNPLSGSPGGAGGSGGNELWSMPGGTGSTDSAIMGRYFFLGTQHLHQRWTHITFLHEWGEIGRTYVKFSAFQGAGGVVNKKFADTDSNGNYVAQDPGLTEGRWFYLAPGDRLSTFQFEHQDGTLGGPRNGAMYMSDIMVDSGYNRVVLSDNAVCTSARHQETQPYTAWPSDDGNLRITLNRGTFPANATAWLHLYNASDVCSPGYPVTLGGGTGTLTAPNNLRVMPGDYAGLLMAGFAGVVLLTRRKTP